MICFSNQSLKIDRYWNTHFNMHQIFVKIFLIDTQSKDSLKFFGSIITVTLQVVTQSGVDCYR